MLLIAAELGCNMRGLAGRVGGGACVFVGVRVGALPIYFRGAVPVQPGALRSSRPTPTQHTAKPLKARVPACPPHFTHPPRCVCS
jgi:hypothetical protein